MSQTQETIMSDEDLDPIETLYAEALRLPTIPSDVHQYGTIIESIKLMLHRLSLAIGELKEESALIKAHVSAEVRAGKATASEKDKVEITQRLAADEDLRIAEARAANLSEAWQRWDARRSRLNRDFEIARIDYESDRRRKDADYEANRRRQSS
jgi:hypothetical protein